MYQEKAEALAEQLGGWAWQSGGEIWLTVVECRGGGVAVFSDECVCEYASVDALMGGERPLNCICLI